MHCRGNSNVCQSVAAYLPELHIRLPVYSDILSRSLHSSYAIPTFGAQLREVFVKNSIMRLSSPGCSLFSLSDTTYSLLRLYKLSFLLPIVTQNGAACQEGILILYFSAFTKPGTVKTNFSLKSYKLM